VIGETSYQFTSRGETVLSMPLVKLSMLSAIQGKPLELIFCYLQRSNKDN